MWERPCARVREQIALFLYGELNHAETREVEAHLAACPRCRAEFAEWERTRGELDLWAAPTVSAERWQEFSFALRERITSPPRRAPRRVTSPARALTFAVALCALAALMFLHRAPRRQTTKEPRIAVIVQKPPALPPRPAATRTQLSSPTAARRPQRRYPSQRWVRLRRAPRRPHREPVKVATTLVAQKPPLNEEPFIEELPQTHALVAVRQTMTPDSDPPSFSYQTTIVHASGQTILSSAVPPGQVSVGTVLARMPIDVVFGRESSD